MFSCLGKKIKLDTCQHILLYRSLFDTHKKYTVVSKVIARCFSDAGQRKETLSTQKEKPNLRQAGSSDTKTRNCILVACVLVAMYMYPTIFKPLLGLDSFGKYTPVNVYFAILDCYVT